MLGIIAPTLTCLMLGRVSAMDCGRVEKIQDQDELLLSHSSAPKMAVSSTLGFKVALWKYALLFVVVL